MLSTAAVIVIAPALLLSVATVADADGPGATTPECPLATSGKSPRNGKPAQMTWVSQLPYPVYSFWVDWDGVQGFDGMPLKPSRTEPAATYTGHQYQVRRGPEPDSPMLASWVVPQSGQGVVTWKSCEVEQYNTGVGDECALTCIDDGVEPEECCKTVWNPQAEENAKRVRRDEARKAGKQLQQDKGPPRRGNGERDAEYESLAHDRHKPCEGPMSNWSCVRLLNYEEVQQRPFDEYGFIDGESKAERAGYQTDKSYTRQIPSIPKVSADGGPGYKVMTMPDSLRIPLLEWYEENKHLMTSHEMIGGYTNNDKIPMHKLNLDSYQKMRKLITDEMQSILEWWTELQLRHTSTYGVRVYHRGSMLINHVDRMDTHLASAVLQVSQDVDEDGGWPLNVLLPDRMTGEVYLQPGEMVLYEGAWLRHGRPQRFKGDNFANIFVHYAPVGWNGPKPYPMRLDEPLPFVYHGYMQGRCDTVADIPGMEGRCMVTDTQESWANLAGNGDGGAEGPEDLRDEL